MNRRVYLGSQNKMPIVAASPRKVVDALPGISPMQLKQQIDRIVKIRQEAAVIRSQFEDAFKRMSQIEKEEKDGLKKLKEAASQMKQKERYLVEAEKGLLEFTAFLQNKAPGVAQMIGDPEDEFGAKAGEFFQRVGKKLGNQIQKAVQEIYVETKNDLTHASDAITGLKVVERKSKTAGLSDHMLAFKEWLSGKFDGFIRKYIKMPIDTWVKGFKNRTSIVKRAVDLIDVAYDELRMELDEDKLMRQKKKERKNNKGISPTLESLKDNEWSGERWSQK